MRKIILFVFSAFLASVYCSDVLAQCGTTPITGDLIISSNQALSGTYNVSGLFRVDPGVVCSVSPYSSGGCGELIVNAVDIEIIGDIIGDGSGFTGGFGGGGGTTGNNVGALTGCIDKDNCLVIDVNGGAAGAPGSGPGAGIPGTGGSIGRGPKQECQNFGDEYGFVGGAGGAGSAGGGSYGGTANTGSTGGNGGAYNSGNFSGMGIAGCASPVAGNGGTGGVIGATYGTPTGTDIDLGSGGAGAGGGGKSASNGSVGTPGGSGGGLVALYASGTLTVAGNISVNGETSGPGGNGGNGGTTGSCCDDLCNDCPERTFSSGAGGGGGSGGGSGGGILLRGFGELNITGTLRSIGGNGGSGGSGGAGTSGCNYAPGFPTNVTCSSNSGSANAGSPGQLGGGGSGGRIKIFQNPCQTNIINANILLNGGNGAGGAAADGTYHLGDIANITAPTLSSSADSVSCFGLSDGSATVVVNGGMAPFNYSWSPIGGNTASASGLPAGSYTVTVIDSNMCEVVETVVIPQPDTLTAQVFGQIDADCYASNTGEASVMGMGGTSPYTYLWNDPAAQTSATASNLPNGTWAAQITDANGCVATDTAVVGEPQPFAASVTVNQDVACYGELNGQATVAANGSNLTYSWNDPALQQTATASNLPAGTWNVTVASSQTCDTTLSVTITEPDSLILVAVQNQAVSCNGGNDGIAVVSQLGGTGPFTYLWDDPNLQTTATATGLEAGSYSVIVTDANNCTAEFQNILVQEPAPIVLTLAQQANVSCFGVSDGLAEISAVGGTPGYTYLWDDPTSQSTAVAGGLSPGTYSVEVTDANGCTSQWLNVMITEPDSLVVSIISTTPITCDYSADGVAEAQVSGGTMPYNYLWDDSDAQSGATAIDLTAGDYLVNVTDANGCTSQASATIGQPVNALIADFSLSPDSGLQPLPITVSNGSVGGTAFEWIFGDGNVITTYDTTDFEYLYADSGAFSVTLISYNDVTGCSDTLTLENGVYVEPTSLILVPNVITPNGDGLNDMFPIDPVANDFFPFKIRNIYDFKGEIYNRWGEKVYEWAQPLGGWDGRTTSGLELKGGTYYYVITAKGIDGDKVTDYQFNGDVTLIR